MPRKLGVAPFIFLCACHTSATNLAPLPKNPVKIASLNPCVDAILLEIADDKQIIGLSHYSFDEKSSSVDVNHAKKFKSLSGEAEDVIALNPDLVIAGSHVSPSTIMQLNRLKIPLLQIGVPQSLEESQSQITQIAEAIGQKGRGAQLNLKISETISKAKPKVNLRPSAIMFQSGGIVPGAGTLANQMLEATGYQNVATQYSQNPWNVLALEPLLSNPPRIVLSGGAGKNGDRILNHRVLQKAKSHFTIANFPSKYLNCAGPNIIPAVQRLAQIRDDNQNGARNEN